MSEAVSAGFDKSDWVIVASGENFPDALSAIALAGSYNAPVVLTSSGELSGQAAAQLRRLSASHVIIVGGDSAVSSRVEKQIADIVGDVTRVSGTDRAQTSVRVMERLRPGRKGSGTVIIASGTSFADALSAGPWAWKTSTPIILAGSDGRLSSEAVNAIKRRGDISRVLFVGGESVVSDAIKNQLGDGYTYVRKGGADRYETSALMAEFSCENGLDWHAPVVATGTDFADALAGAPLAGKVGSPLLLADKTGGKAADAVARNAKSVRQVYVLGGESAVPDAAEKALTRSLS